MNGDSTTIGRSSECGLSLADRSLSRRHARLFRDGDRWYVEDLGSRNGTLVNGARISGPQALTLDAVVNLGASTFRLQPQRIARDDVDVNSQTIFRPATELLTPAAMALDITSPEDPSTLQRSVERLRVLNEVHQALDRPIDLEELIELILDRAFEHLRPDEGSIFLRRRDGTVHCAVSRSLRGTDHRCLYSRNLIHQVAEKGQAALVLDAAIDDRFNQAASLMSAGIRSLVAAPLLDPDGCLGMIVLGSMLHARQFVEADMELLTSLASVAAMRIRNVHLSEEAEERRRLERDVGLARKIQIALLPDALPEIAGYELHARNVPSRGVSGDFYKVTLRSGGDCIIQVADVSGKGIAAALLTGSLEALSAGLIDAKMAPEHVCEQVSRLLFQRTPPEKYATMILAVLEPGSGRLRHVNAGHNQGLWLHADGTGEWLDSTGLPVGMLPASTYSARDIVLQPGDAVILYTDGITEAENPDGEEYGKDRLRELCSGHRTEPLDALAAAVEQDVERFADGVPFADDRTMVLLRRRRR